MSRKAATRRSAPPSKRQRSTRRRLPKLVRLLIPLAVIALMAFLYWQPLNSYRDARARLAARSLEVSTLRARNDALQAQLASVDKGPVLLREARQLGLVRPGERLFIVQGIDAWRAGRHAKIAGHG